MSPITTWRDLKVWQKAHELVLLTYHLTTAFPGDERYGPCSQMRRAAVSVASNLVEGFHRRTVKDSLSFYNQSNGSLEELKYQYLIAYDLKYLNQIDYLQAIKVADGVGKLLYRWSMSQRVNASAA